MSETRRRPLLELQLQSSKAPTLSKEQLDSIGGHYATPQERTMLVNLRDGYKRAALGYKLNGFMDNALRMFRVAKQLDIMIDAIDTNKPIDLKGLPGPAPNVPIKRMSVLSGKIVKKARAPQPPTTVPIVQVAEPEIGYLEDIADVAPTRRRLNPEDWTRLTEGVSANVSEGTTPNTGLTPSSSISNIRSSSPIPSIVSEEVETRDKAAAEGNTSKTRRLGRIVKQYETAMKSYKEGKEIDYDSLPCPPGFPSIPIVPKLLSEEPRRLKRNGNRSVGLNSDDVSLNDVNAVINEILSQTNIPLTTNSGHSSVAVSASASAAASPYSSPLPQPRIPKERPKTELNEKVDELVEKQSSLKKAAIDARNSGNIDDAKRYLRLMKGFDPIIEAVKCGLPIDESTIPAIPPEILMSNMSLKN